MYCTSTEKPIEMDYWLFGKVQRICQFVLNHSCHGESAIDALSWLCLLEML